MIIRGMEEWTGQDLSRPVTVKPKDTIRLAVDGHDVEVDISEHTPDGVYHLEFQEGHLPVVELDMVVVRGIGG